MPRSGAIAEDKAVDFLAQEGYQIISRNWRTRWCEIDIVALKDGAIYFVEVKYRARPFWGEGIDYITAQKLRQMQFAAEFWVSSHNWRGDYFLSALSLAGKGFLVDYFVEDVSR